MASKMILAALLVCSLSSGGATMEVNEEHLIKLDEEKTSAMVYNDSRLHGDMINAVRKELCPSNPTMNDCEYMCCRRLNDISDIPVRDDENSSLNIDMLCRSENRLTIGWSSSKNNTKNHVYLAEIMEYENSTGVNSSWSSNILNFTVTKSPYVTFYNLTDNTSYQVCVTSFYSSGIYDKRHCGLFNTLIDNFPLNPVKNITLDYLKFNHTNGFNASIKWQPGEDYTCYYNVAVFAVSEFFLAIEVQVLRNTFNAILFDLEYSTTYSIKVAGADSNRNRESEQSWFTFTTPSCMETHDSLKMCAPPTPTDLKAIEEISEKQPKSTQDENVQYYDITISWKKPEKIPDYYYINLTKNDYSLLISQQNISGKKTEARFKNMNVGNMYQISLSAGSKGGISKSIEIHREIKLVKQEPQVSSTLLWAVLTPIFSFIFILGLAAFIYHRHEKLKLYKRRCRYFEGLEQKAPKELDSGSSFTIHPDDDAFEIVPDKLILYEMLGEGAFGVVRKGWIPDKNREVAVKMLKDEPSAEEVKQFRQEIDMMKSVGSHPHIVSLVGCCTRPTATMMLIVEFCPCGDLQNYLRGAWDAMASKSFNKPLTPSDMNLVNSNDEDDSNGQIKYAELVSSENSEGTSLTNFPQPNFIINRLYDLEQNIEENKTCDLTPVDLLSFCRQIALGMEYLSSNRVVHRDLAARNVLVCSDKTVKIADFGLSRDIYQENMYRKTGTGKLPIKWMALESLTHQVYTTQSDVWSYGILLWEIVTLGGNPYPSVPSGRLLKLLMSGYRMDCPSNCSPDLYGLMMACWRSRPKERPTFSDIRQKIDVLLDGMCSHAYLSLNILDYKDMNELNRNVSEQFSKSSCNSLRGIDKCVESERYVRPISLGKTKSATNSSQFNHYSSQPIVLQNSFNKSVDNFNFLSHQSTSPPRNTLYDPYESTVHVFKSNDMKTINNNFSDHRVAYLNDSVNRSNYNASQHSTVSITIQ